MDRGREITISNTWTEPTETVNALWAMACNGQIGRLKKYYENGGKAGCRYNRLGMTHSLISGAWRNRQYDTVKYLLQVGETIEPHEAKEIDLQKLYLPDVIMATENLIEYFRYHNKNLTKVQEEKVAALAEVLELIRR